MDRVELHQQRVLFGVADRIVQQDDVATCACIDKVAQDKFADPAKAVEGDTGHDLSLP